MHVSGAEMMEVIDGTCENCHIMTHQKSRWQLKRYNFLLSKNLLIISSRSKQVLSKNFIS